MPYVFNVFTGTFDATADGIAEYSTFSSFPATAGDGDVALALDTKTLYVYDIGSASWKAVAKPGDALSVGVYDSGSPVSAGLQINASSAIIAQSATASFPGMVNTTTQTFSGNKTFSGTTTLASPFTLGATSVTSTGTQLNYLNAAMGTTGSGSVVYSTSPTFVTSVFFPGTSSIDSSGNAVFGGSVSAASFSGSGASLTSLNASNLSSGTVPAAQMPAFTGDITTSAGSTSTTLATVNTNTGSFGSSTAIPNFTVNGKGLITAAGTNVVVAPAGTLSGTTLNATVVSSSLTSVGIITSGTWNASTITVGFGGLGIITTPTNGQIPIGNGTNYTAATITAGTGISVSNGSGSITISSSSALSTDIPPTSFSAANNISSPANVTGLTFSNSTVRGFQAFVAVFVNATTSLYEAFELQGIQNGSSWDMSATSNGDSSGFTFTITTAGQVQYVNSNYTGFSAATVKFRAITLGT